MIVLKNVSKAFKKRNALFNAIEPLSLELPSSSLIVLSGKSGSGKTTLLNIIGGLDSPSEGTIYFNEKVIDSKTVDDYRSKNVGYVFQEYNLLNNVSIAENLRIAFDLRKEKPTLERMSEILSLVGLPDKNEDVMAFLKKRPVELSGGQRQRIAVARALIKDPGILLLDEPTAALDENNSTSLLKLLKTISKDRLVIISTHNTNLAKRFADRIIKLEDGKLVSDETFDCPKEGRCLDGNKKRGTLSFPSLARGALRGLIGKKVRLITSITLSVIVTTMIGLLVSVETSNQNEAVLRSQYEDGHSASYMMIGGRSKAKKLFDYDLNCELTDDQMAKISNFCGDKKPINICHSPLSFYHLVETPEGYSSPSNVFYTSIECGIGKDYAMVLDPETGLEDAGLQRDPRLKNSTSCELPRKEGEIAITDYQAEYIFRRGLVGESLDSLDDLIGKTVTGGLRSSVTEEPPQYKITGIFKTTESLEWWCDHGEDDGFDAGDFSEGIKMAFGFSVAQLSIVPLVHAEENDPYRMIVPLSGSLQKDLNFINSLSYVNEEGDHCYVEALNSYAYLANDVINLKGNMGIFIYGLLAISILISFLLSLNFFYTNVKGMERELGIIRAMGATKGDVRGIVFAQGLFLGLVELVLSIAMILLGNSLANARIHLSLLTINWPVFLSVFLTIFASAALVSWLASIKAIRQRPVNVIDDK